MLLPSVPCLFSRVTFINRYRLYLTMTVSFLPISMSDGKKQYKGFIKFDVIFITGDPYFDHPLSGTAILARLLDSKGYSVGIIPQPTKSLDFEVCGRPKYFFCITSGLLDSMLANYT